LHGFVIIPRFHVKHLRRLFVVAALLCALPSYGSSNYLENKLLDYLLRAQSFTAPATVYVGLSTTACSDGSNGTEVSGGSYARVAVTSSLANWASTQGNTSASSGTGGTTSNVNAITFAIPTVAWGTVGWWFIADASTSGNQLFCGALTNSRVIGVGDTVRFPAGSLVITLQ
jgi:hypothetical protein